jgi:hypothetical protein
MRTPHEADQQVNPTFRKEDEIRQFLSQKLEFAKSWNSQVNPTFRKEDEIRQFLSQKLEFASEARSWLGPAEWSCSAASAIGLWDRILPSL